MSDEAQKGKLSGRAVPHMQYLVKMPFNGRPKRVMRCG
jgi:hypothetical protein